ncbi:MAG: long-chain fatty acid--CoA ligase [Proteobacteria bacterium]|nr:long-chain fatty acid--CoA ligase [Pseudomonadota bacterium]
MPPGIGYWLTKRELLTPEKEAVVDGNRRLNYRMLNHRVNRLARGLAGSGLRTGDRLAMLAYNGIEFVEVIMAAAKLGLILVPLNWRLTAAELAFIVNDSQTGTLVFDPALADPAGELRGLTELSRLIVLGTEDRFGARGYELMLADESPEEPVPDAAPDLDSPHIIMYTAGTTGRPKGAILSQGASFWNALNLESCDFTSRDRDLLVLPMFHIGGIGLFTLPMLYVGGTVVVMRAFDPAEAFRLLAQERISLFFGVPAIFLFMIQHPDFDPAVFRDVRLIMSGGAPLPASLVRQYHERGIVLQQGFGMSEAGPSIATLGKELALSKAGSIGRPVFHLDVRVVDDDLNEAPRGEVGELVMRGPNIMQGYWNRPEATEEAFAGGWFHSGDLARMDDDGDLYIVERKKDMFISGGENVYPAEVEDAIYELEAVAEAAVIGVRDERWGEVGRAVIVVKPGRDLSEAEIIGHLQGRLAKYKIPRSVVFAEVLPRNAAGKVLKTVLRDQI